MLSKLSMVIIDQVDVDSAVSFYENLGLSLCFHLPGAWAEFQMNDIKLGLCSVGKAFIGVRTGIVFEVEDLRSVYGNMKELGVSFLGEPVERVHGIMANFKDPSGNILDLYQPTPEKVRALVEKEKADSGCKDGGSCVDHKASSQG